MPILLPQNHARIDELLMMLRNAVERFPVLHLSPVDRIVDSKDEYVLNRLASGRYALKPNITRQGILFRGDSHYHEVFRTRYGQKEIIGHGPEVREKIIPVNVRRSDFEIAIESFPLYKMLKNGIVLPNGKKLVMENPFGLAYAYDQPTPFVGLTSDLDVAAFYAVTEYDAESGKYTPVTTGMGVIYAFELRMPFSMTIGLSSLGRLIFPRTLQQKTFLLNINPEYDFNQMAVVNGFVFNHDAALSRAIYDRFDGGEKLAPKEDFLLKKIQKFPKNTVSEQGFMRNLSENKGDSRMENENILSRAGVRIDGNLNPAFTYDELKGVYSNIASYWQSMIEGVYVGGNHGADIKKFLMNLPWNPDYSQYFDLNRYFDAR